MADWKRYLKDKRVWAGAAVVAAVAVVMAVRSRSSGGPGTPGSGGNPAPSGYYQAAGDTTGTDLSGFLGNWGSAHLAAQQEGFKSILDALKDTQAAPGQNDDAPPSVIFTRDDGGRPLWAVLNSPYGGWMQTDSQATANSWAAQWESDEIANTVDWGAWQKLKAKWDK